MRVRWVHIVLGSYSLRSLGRVGAFQIKKKKKGGGGTVSFYDLRAFICRTRPSIAGKGEGTR
jgi:hypothetical protein